MNTEVNCTIWGIHGLFLKWKVEKYDDGKNEHRNNNQVEITKKSK